MERLRKHRDFLRRLFTARKLGRQRNIVISRANNAEVCAVCELIKNLLHNPTLHIRLSAVQKKELKRHRRLLEALIKRATPSEKKRRILQKGAGGILLPLVLGLVAPLVTRLLKKTN